MGKKLIVQMLTIIMILSMLCAGVYADEMLGLGYGKKDFLSGLTTVYVETTPPEYSFSFEGQNFAFLGGYIGTDGINAGYREEEGKNYYLILADQLYDKVAFDSDNGNLWSVTDESTTGYWLNEVFISDTYEGTKLPQAMTDNLAAYKWHTEPTKNVEGYTTEFVTESKLAIMSQYEFIKYSGMYGYNMGANYWSRTSYDVYPLYLQSSTARMREAGATGAMGVRPIFWLSEDFFLQNKITVTDGSYIARSLAASGLTEEEFLTDNGGGYSEEELESLFPPPTVAINTISGIPIEGEILTVDYTYESSLGLSEADTVIKWYSSSERGGEYTEIVGATGESYKVEPSDDGKYIKASVTPAANSKINATGAEVIADNSMAIGPIYGENYMKTVIKTIDDTAANDIFSVLGLHNLAFGLDLALDGFTEAEKANTAQIFADSTLTDFDSVVDNYNDAKNIAKLNTATEKEAAKALLESLKAEEELAQFNSLNDTDRVLEEIMGKGFKGIAEFDAAFNKAVAVQRINEADLTNVKAALKDNMELFTEDLAEADDYELGKIGALILGSYTDFDTLYSSVEEAIEEVREELEEVSEPKKNSSGKGSSGGGGGRVSIPAASAVVVTPTPIVEEPAEENKESESSFGDIDKNHWAYESVKELSDSGIISGDENGNFRPEDTLKREEFVKMMVLAFCENAKTAETKFTDIESDAWYSEYISVAVGEGIINGMSEEIFGIGENISRQDMAVIIYRAVGESIKSEIPADFKDLDTVSGYAKEAVNALYSAEIMSGDGENANPHANATRAEAAKIICSAIRYRGGNAQ